MFDDACGPDGVPKLWAAGDVFGVEAGTRATLVYAYESPEADAFDCVVVKIIDGPYEGLTAAVAVYVVGRA